jgi:two-component system phosphate regulon sensor histidine kinase PhoR
LKSLKLNRTYVFIGISSIALVIVLIIQVNWIIQTAEIKEQLFNEKANIVLAKTAEALSENTNTCKSISENTQPSADIVIGSCQKTELCITNSEIRSIDSVFKHFMNYYNFYIDYSFVLVKPSPFRMASEENPHGNVYNRRLAEVVSKNGAELVMILPDKDQFIMDEMGTPFISSVILILVVLVMFWRTVLSLMKEKRISEHTTEFLNNMTHEFKTPLTNIGLAGKMLLKDPAVKQEDKLRHYTGIILDENEKLRLQVEQMLSMTALERGEIKLQKTELDMHQLIRDAVKYMGIQLENSHGEVKLNLDAEKFVVIADKTHLTSAICNLIDNAVKYSKGKPELCITTSNHEQDLLIRVSDKGIGIEKEYQERVFDKFFRVPTGNVHDVKGFGLGLAYIKKVIELHDGLIELVSEKEHGTEFTLTIEHA